MKRYDAAIIGFGKGGKTLAAKLAAAGKSVAVIEKSKRMYGGTCINVGCIPSKSLFHSAGFSAMAGGGFQEKTKRYGLAVAQRERLTAMLREKNYRKLADDPNIEVLDGEASFLSGRRLSVQTENGAQEIEADVICINTGASPFVPPLPGLKDNPHVYTSAQLMELRELPRKLVIIGGGYIGMEFASMYANFGAQVSVIQDGGDFLPREDEEIAAEVKKSLEARGVKLFLSAKIKAVEEKEEYSEIVFDMPEQKELRLPANAILAATGRRPHTEGLNLEKAGVALTARGAVKTDEQLRTSVPHIFAMGDVTGGLQFTYISLDDSRIVASALLGGRERTTENRGAVPYSVFLDPPFSRVGLSEKEARAQYSNVKTARLPAAAIPKAQVVQKAAGLLKAVIDGDTGLILGAHLFCEESHEMINLIKLAMDAQLPYTALRDAVYTHPTMSEALNDLFAAVQ